MREKFIPVLLLITVGLAFAVGVLWQKVNSLEGGGVKVSGSNNQPTTQITAPDVSGKLSEDQAKKVQAVNDKDHIQGSKEAKVILIEYSDLQCPFCQKFHPTAKQALAEYKGQFAWVYRHFPLSTIHPKAQPAAEASECVAALAGEDTFWKFTDKIFEGQPDSLDKMKSIAISLGVDGAEYDSCTTSHKYKSRVDVDYGSGTAAGVNGTPGNFIMNKKGEVWVIPGAVPYESLKATIDSALKS